MAQQRLGAALVARMLRTWPLLDLADLDRTAPRWLTVAEALVNDTNRRSAELGRTYYSAFRTIELGVGADSFRPTLAPLVPPDALDTSLMVTGPVHLRSAIERGDDPTRASAVARSMAARSAMRHGLAGGRDTVTRASQNDPRAVGWSRVTSGAPCAFCAAHAGRGPVTLGSEAAPEVSKFHDGCSCTLQPSYSASEPPSPQATAYRQVWDQTTAGLSGDEAYAAFRQAVEG